MNIFFAGNKAGAYRTGSALKCIIDSQQHGIYMCNYSKTSIRKHPIKGGIIRLLHIFLDIIAFIECDVIYLSIMSHDSVILKIAKKMKKPIITEIYLSLYDTYVIDRKTVQKNTRRAKELFEADRYALKNSTKIILLAEADKQYYSNLLGVDFGNIDYSVIPVVVNDKRKAKLDYFHGKKTYMQLCWTGSYIPLQGLDRVLKAMRIVKEKSEIPIKLYVWGANNPNAKQYEQMVNDLQINDCVTIHNEWGNLDKWENFIAENCDVTVGIFGNTDKAKYVMANKVIDGMAFRTPVITAHSTGVYDFCNGKDDIFIIDNTPESIAEEIMKISKMDLSYIEKRVNNAYKIYDENFSTKAFNKKFMSMLSQIDNQH